MTIGRDKITEIFYMADNFCQLYDRFIKVNGLARKRDKSKRKYHRDSTPSDAEVITIMILFHLCGYKCLKHGSYENYVLSAVPQRKQFLL